MFYTVDVYLKDHRFKAGEHMVNQIDLKFVSRAAAEAWGLNHYKDPSRQYRFEIHETMVSEQIRKFFGVLDKL